MMNWNDILEKQSGGKEKRKTQYTSFKPGKEPVKIKVRVLDEQPRGRKTHFMNVKTEQGFTGRTFTCHGDKDCPVCKTGENYSTKYGINVWNYTTGQVEIMERGIEYFRQIAGLATAYNGLDKNDLEITIRKGEGKKLIYTIIALPPTDFKLEDVTDEEKYDIDELWKSIGVEKLQQLLDGVNVDEVFAKKEETTNSSGFGAIDDSDIPF